MTDNPNVYQGQLGDARPNDVQISADGSTIYAAGADGHLYVYNATDGSLLHHWSVGTNLGGMDVSPDGSFAVITELQPIATIPGPGIYDYPTYQVTVHKVGLSTGTVTNFNYTTTGFDYSFYDTKILSDGKVLLTRVRIWRISVRRRDHKLLDLLTGHYSDTAAGTSANSVLTGSGSAMLVGFPGSSDAPLEIPMLPGRASPRSTIGMQKRIRASMTVFRPSTRKAGCRAGLYLRYRDLRLAASLRAQPCRCSPRVVRWWNFRPRF